MNNAARTPSAERRRHVLGHAVSEFAQCGLKGTSTQAIAARCGLSQPYLVRLFDSKAALFLAALEHGFEIAQAEASRRATHQDGVRACEGIMQGREGELARLVLHGCAAACDDAQVADLLRRRLRRLADQSGRCDEDLLAQLLRTAGGLVLGEMTGPLGELAP